MTVEPLIHSHEVDVLPGDDPRAYDILSCHRCGTMVHACNNECMVTWLDWPPYILCGPCAAPLIADGVLQYADFERLAKGA